LYRALQRIHDTPVVRLNRAVAVAMSEGPDAGLRLIDDVAVELDAFHPLHAARADLLRRAGRRAEATAAYARAIAVCANVVERRYLERRLAEVS
jgi:RNA polymerase sigma-70 factor (ECF subfamily)